ncbi:MAG: phosphoribosyltransferase family protein [bacterium]|nr:phosphoribosyltransferase family protein [bacterium]
MKIFENQSVFKTVAIRVLDFLVPETCVGCKTTGIALCDICVQSIPPPTYGAFRDIISLFDYQNKIIRKALWALKYKGGKRIGKILGTLMYERILKTIQDEQGMNDFKQAVLIPIPLSRKRLKERGFNQSEILAEELSFRDQGKKFTVETSVLYRIRDTGSQALIKDRETRMNNIKGCFSINNKNKILGKNIILIDDITTTGATLEEAKKVLVDNGARRVIAFTVGH